ncbi:GNAT family protein [Acidothermaceae bacterium B102]|nr:GNAT family protein [Acidothermaceae bacterium B102]
MSDLPVVVLRPLVEADGVVLEAAYAVAAADPYSWPGHRRPGWMTQQIVDGTMHTDTGANLAITDEAGALVGDVQYRQARTGSSVFSWCWSLGIMLLPEWRGRGYGAAAQREVARYLFLATTAERVEADTDVDNIAEQRALERAGFTREGIRRRSMFRDGEWHDTVGYAVVRGEL